MTKTRITDMKKYEVDKNVLVNDLSIEERSRREKMKRYIIFIKNLIGCFILKTWINCQLTGRKSGIENYTSTLTIMTYSGLC